MESGWTDAEFDTMVSNPELSDVEMTAWLPQRNARSIGSVRAAIHAFHTCAQGKLKLSPIMVRVLQKRSCQTTCPICRDRF